MKKLILLIGILIFISSCGEAAKSEKRSENGNIETTKINKEKPVLALADFDTKAEKFVNKEVEVSGIVDHVCKHGGKKILLVDNGGDVHVESEKRFDDALVGNEISVTGIVKEFVVDEAFCLKKETDHIQNHKEGTDSDEVYDKKMKEIKFYRDSMKTAGVDHLSFYSLEYVSHRVKK